MHGTAHAYTKKNSEEPAQTVRRNLRHGECHKPDVQWGSWWQWGWDPVRFGTWNIGCMTRGKGKVSETLFLHKVDM